jgi:hypothetical protein
MTRILTEGFEMGDALGWSSPSQVGVVTSDEKRSGVYSLHVGEGDVAIFPFSEVTEVFLRVGVFLTQKGYSYGNTVLTLDDDHSNHHIAVDWNTTTNVFDVFDSTGALVGSTTTILSYDKWYLLEIHALCHTSTGTMTVKVDGITELDVTGLNTWSDSAANAFMALVFGRAGTYAVSADMHLDDIAINNTAGEVDDSWCGEGRIIALKPNANGASSEWVGSDVDSTDNYLLVDEIPADEDTSYVESSTVDDFDLYNCEASGLTDVTILRVWPEARARATIGDGTGKIRLGVKSNTTEAWDAADTALMTTYTQRVIGDELLEDPATATTWTPAGVDALQVGVKAK